MKKPGSASALTLKTGSGSVFTSKTGSGSVLRPIRIPNTVKNYYTIYRGFCAEPGWTGEQVLHLQPLCGKHSKNSPEFWIRI